jgi:hypothetical protein
LKKGETDVVGLGMQAAEEQRRSRGPADRPAAISVRRHGNLERLP